MNLCDHTPGLTFDDADHAYYLDGRRVPGVTTLLDRAGIIPAESKQWWTPEARERGSDVHTAIHFLNEGDLDRASLRPAIIPYLDAYESFVSDLRVNVLAAELRLGHRVYRYAGTLDLLCWIWIGGRFRFAIIDFKSSANFHGWHAVQVAGGYAALVKANCTSLGLDAKSLPDYYAIVHLTADGKYRLIEIDVLTQNVAINTFQAALVCYNFNREK